MRGLYLTFCLGFALQGAIDPDLPSQAPIVRAAFPPGAQRGTTIEVELTGQNLHDAQSIEFAGRGIRAKIADAFASKLKVKITIDATAEVGRREYRLTTSRGVCAGAFDIGALPEVVETENNDHWRKPQPITLPVLVNGVIGNEDWDHFRFHASAGQKMIFDVSATRYGSRLDSDLAILDAQGRELAWVDDTTIFGDPHIEFTFEKEGDYIVRVGSLNGGGNYRLAAGVLPYPRRVLPAGLQAGQPTELTFTGSLLDQVDEVWIGDRLAKGQLLSRTGDAVRARFQVPVGTPPGRYLAHVAAAGREVALPTEIRVSHLPEVTVAATPSERANAQPISPSVVLNGVIQQPKQSHYFRFQAKAGETFLLRAESMKLGYHLDPTITVLDAEGSKVAFADDPGIDDRADEYQLDPDLSFRCETSGVYFVAIRDGMYRGGEQLLYRLTVRRQAPNFFLELREPLKSFYAGQHDTVQVRVRRRSGWSAPVEVWAEGLPTAITAERQVVPPVDSIVKDTCGVERVVDGSIVLLPIRVGNLASGTFDIKIKGRGVMDGRTVEHEAIVRYGHNSVGHLYGPMQIARAQLTVAQPPPVLITAPDSATSSVKLSIRRFGPVKDAGLLVRPRNLPEGVRIAPAPVTAKEVTLPVEGRLPAEGARLILEVVSTHDDKVIAESAPILLKAPN